jgi:DNA-3-methyladenine glycosylase II
VAQGPPVRLFDDATYETGTVILPDTAQCNNAVALHAVLAMRRRASRPSRSRRAATPIGTKKHYMGQRQASLAFTLHPVPPFRLDLTVWALRRRSRNLIDRWDGTTYRRVIVLGGRPTELAVRQSGASATPTLSMTATPPPRTLLEQRRVRAIVNRLLGLRIDLTDWYQMAADDARLRLIADKFRGMKPPRFPTMFEAVVNAFACQQLSLEVGLELLNRLATISSARLGRLGDLRYAFPAAPDIAGLPPAKYRAIGFSRQKVRALLDLARPITRRELELELLAREDETVVRQRLLELRGVGRWTAEYVLLRGLGRLHVFPGDDVGAQKRLARWLGRPRPLDYAGVRRAVERWQPYAGLVYFHLLLDGLSQAGTLESTSEPESRVLPTRKPTGRASGP